MTTAPQFTAAKAAQPAWPRRSIRAALLVAGFALAACDGLPPGTIPTVSAPATVAPLPPESVALAAYYQRLQQELLTQGLLRTDGGGPDTPFSDLRLAQNFVRIALLLHDHYQILVAFFLKGSHLGLSYDKLLAHGFHSYPCGVNLFQSIL